MRSNVYKTNIWLLGSVEIHTANCYASWIILSPITQILLILRTMFVYKSNKHEISFLRVYSMTIFLYSWTLILSSMEALLAGSLVKKGGVGGLFIGAEKLFFYYFSFWVTWPLFLKGWKNSSLTPLSIRSWPLFAVGRRIRWRFSWRDKKFDTVFL